MTVLRNDNAPHSIHFVRSNWVVTVEGKPHDFKTVAEWLQNFKNNGVAKPALIAFRWAQFPPEQTYEPGGDWNQGMLALGLPAATRFTIEARWDTNGQNQSAKLTEVQCASRLN